MGSVRRCQWIQYLGQHNYRRLCLSILQKSVESCEVRISGDLLESRISLTVTCHMSAGTVVNFLPFLILTQHTVATNYTSTDSSLVCS